MERTIRVGEREMAFKSSAATNILYKRAFHEDILVKLTAYTKNLKDMTRLKEEVDSLKESGKTDEQIMAELNVIMQSETYLATQSFSSETLPKLAYIMFLEANEKIGNIFTKLNEENYLAWLMELDQDGLLTVTGEVMDVWQSGARTHSKIKN